MSWKNKESAISQKTVGNFKVMRKKRSHGWNIQCYVCCLATSELASNTGELC